MKFNFLSLKSHQVQNRESAKAFVMTPETELYAAVATTGLGDSFYESGDVRMQRIRSLMQKCNPVFVAKLAVYVRAEMHLRSVPLMLAVELAKQQSGNALVSSTVKQVVRRADEIAELLAYYQIANERTSTKKLNSLSKQVQKGLAAAFNNFDEYQFAKYNRNTDVKLRDALFLVHPKAKDESQQAILDGIVSNTLATPYTWEKELSQAGQQKYASQSEKALAMTRIWEELIDSRKLGYMATLRNLRNMLDANVSPGHVRKLCVFLTDEKAVAHSKQLPFRFLAAYREMKVLESQHVAVVPDALEDAVMHSAANIKGFGANTSVVIACDVSGSMQKPVFP